MFKGQCIDNLTYVCVAPSAGYTTSRIARTLERASRHVMGLKIRVPVEGWLVQGVGGDV